MIWLGLLLGRLTDRWERRRAAREDADWSQYWESVLAIWDDEPDDQDVVDELELHRAMKRHPAGRGRRQ